MFNPENIHEVDIPGLGRFEAYANGDSLPYAELLGIDPRRLERLGRYSFRWPGHCAFWKKLVDLHLLDDEPLHRGRRHGQPPRTSWPRPSSPTSAWARTNGTSP